MEEEERVIVQAAVSANVAKKLDTISALASVRRADVIRKAVDNYIDDFEGRNGEINVMGVEL